MDSLFDLESKVVVVTGGAGLLGRALSLELARRKATVYVADQNLVAAEKVCLECDSDTVFPLSLDITDDKNIAAAVDHVVSKSGHVDGWVNGAYPRTPDWGTRFEDVPAESWRKNIDAHLNGYCFCCQKVLEVMKSQGSGSLVNIASIYGILGADFSIYEGLNMTMPAAYAVIKGGIVNFTRYLATYYGKHSIRINTVSPGGLKSDQSETFIKRYSDKVPLGRMGNAEDIVGAIVFLLSNASRYMTGQNLVIDGGWSIL